MIITTLLEYSDRAQLREWFEANHAATKEVWVAAYRSQRKNDLPQLPYLEVVEETLCLDGLTRPTNACRTDDWRNAYRLVAKVVIGRN